MLHTVSKTIIQIKSQLKHGEKATCDPGIRKARITKNNFPKDMTKKLLQNSCFLKHGKIATPKKK